jgi:3-hydroxy acid dehydrogenase / malonic semialdehyde reductase
MDPLSGRRALVTGASSGIGAATARALAGAGAQVVLAARREDRLEEVARALPGSTSLAVDVRDAGAVAEAFSGLEVDVLVLNAGLSIGMEKLQDGVPEDWSVAIDTNVKGVLRGWSRGSAATSS